MAVLIGLIKALVVIGVALNIVPVLIYLERKLSAYIQGRVGPNRVNFVIAGVKLVPGSLQPLADAVKLAFKEEIVPRDADKFLWYMGPFLAFFPSAVALAFIPFGTPTWNAFGTDTVVDLRIASANMGILALLAIGSLAVYGIAVGGWGSGSKFPLMSAVRASAQMVSYELAMGLALIAAIATVGSIDLQEFVIRQATSWEGFGWLVFKQPLAALLFLVAAFAETNRLPFDMVEAEPELVGGFHTEYTGLKFGLFFLGEYLAMIVMSAVFVTVFLGGWSFPGIVDPLGTSGLNALASAAVFMVKLGAVLTFYIWIRWTLPRFRYDQIMKLGWKVMVPLALVNLMVTAVVLTFI